MEYCYCCFNHQVVPNSSVTPRTVARQAPLSMEFPRQECWSGLPFPSLEDLPGPEDQIFSPALKVEFLPLSHQRSPTVEYYLAIKRMK